MTFFIRKDVMGMPEENDGYLIICADCLLAIESGELSGEEALKSIEANKQSPITINGSELESKCECCNGKVFL